jgi:hypothetical protein
MATAAPDGTWWGVVGVMGFVKRLSEVIGAFKNAPQQALSRL